MASETPDYYEILQISPTAEPETVHKVYRLLAQRCHPDNKETGNEAQFRQLSEAYHALSDPERRAKYDVGHTALKEARWRLVENGAHSANDFESEQLYRRATKIDSGISLATVYRTVRLFEEARILERHDFGDGRARYEEAPTDHHDHLIDIQSREVIEFTNQEIEKLQHRVAEQLGYKLVGHRLELYAVPLHGKG